MIVVDGYIGNDPEFRTPARLYIEEANANIAGMQKQLYFDLEDGGDGFRARADRDLHAEPEGRGLPERPAHRGRPRAGRHPRLQLRLLRRVEEGRPAHVEQARLRARRPAAARRLQGDPDRRRRQGRPDRRPLGHRQDHHHLHAPERLAADPGRLRGDDAGRQGLRHRGRLLRQDLRAQHGGRADDLRRGHRAGGLPRERLAGRARRGRLLRHELHAERPRDLRVQRDRGGRRAPSSTRRTSC